MNLGFSFHLIFWVLVWSVDEGLIYLRDSVFEKEFLLMLMYTMIKNYDLLKSDLV